MAKTLAAPCNHSLGSFFSRSVYQHNRQPVVVSSPRAMRWHPVPLQRKGHWRSSISGKLYYRVGRTRRQIILPISQLSFGPESSQAPRVTPARRGAGSGGVRRTGHRRAAKPWNPSGSPLFAGLQNAMFRKGRVAFCPSSPRTTPGPRRAALQYTEFGQTCQAMGQQTRVREPLYQSKDKETLLSFLLPSVPTWQRCDAVPILQRTVHCGRALCFCAAHSLHHIVRYTFACGRGCAQFEQQVAQKRRPSSCAAPAPQWTLGWDPPLSTTPKVLQHDVTTSRIPSPYFCSVFSFFAHSSFFTPSPSKAGLFWCLSVPFCWLNNVE